MIRKRNGVTPKSSSLWTSAAAAAAVVSSSHRSVAVGPILPPSSDFTSPLHFSHLAIKNAAATVSSTGNITTSSFQLSCLKHIASPFATSISHNNSSSMMSAQSHSRQLNRGTSPPSDIFLKQFDLPERLINQKELFKEASGWLSVQREKFHLYSTVSPQQSYIRASPSFSTLSQHHKQPLPTNNNHLSLHNTMNSSTAFPLERHTTAASTTTIGAHSLPSDTTTSKKPNFYERKTIYNLKHFLPRTTPATSTLTTCEDTTLSPQPPRIISSAQRKTLLRDFDIKVSRYIKSLMLSGGINSGGTTATTTTTATATTKKQHRMYKHVEKSIEDMNSTTTLFKGSSSLHTTTSPRTQLTSTQLLLTSPPSSIRRGSLHTPLSLLLPPLNKMKSKPAVILLKTYYQLNGQQMEVISDRTFQLLNEQQKSRYNLALDHFKREGSRFTVRVEQKISGGQQLTETSHEESLEYESKHEQSQQFPQTKSSALHYNHFMSIESSSKQQVASQNGVVGGFPHGKLQEMMLSRYGAFLASATTDYDEKLRAMRVEYEKILENFEKKSFSIILPPNVKPRGQGFNDYYVTIEPPGENSKKVLIQCVFPKVTDFQAIIESEFQQFTVAQNAATVVCSSEDDEGEEGEDVVDVSVKRKSVVHQGSRKKSRIMSLVAAPQQMMIPTQEEGEGEGEDGVAAAVLEQETPSSGRHQQDTQRKNKQDGEEDEVVAVVTESEEGDDDVNVSLARNSGVSFQPIVRWPVLSNQNDIVRVSTAADQEITRKEDRVLEEMLINNQSTSIQLEEEAQPEEQLPPQQQEEQQLPTDQQPSQASIILQPPSHPPAKPSPVNAAPLKRQGKEKAKVVAPVPISKLKLKIPLADILDDHHDRLPNKSTVPLGTGLLNDLLNSDDLFDFDVSDYIGSVPFRTPTHDEKVHHDSAADERVFIHIATWQLLIEEENINHEFWRISLQKRLLENYWPEKLADILKPQDEQAADIVRSMSCTSIEVGSSSLRKLKTLQEQLTSATSSSSKKFPLLLQTPDKSKTRSLFQIIEPVTLNDEHTAEAQGGEEEEEEEDSADDQSRDSQASHKGNSSHSSSHSSTPLNPKDKDLLQTIQSISDFKLSLNKINE